MTNLSTFTRAPVLALPSGTDALVRFAAVTKERGRPGTRRGTRASCGDGLHRRGNLDIDGNNDPVEHLMNFQHVIRAQKQPANNNPRGHDLQREQFADVSWDRLINDVVAYLLDGVTEPVLKGALRYWSSVAKYIADRVEAEVPAAASHVD